MIATRRCRLATCLHGAYRPGGFRGRLGHAAGVVRLQTPRIRTRQDALAPALHLEQLAAEFRFIPQIETPRFGWPSISALT